MTILSGPYGGTLSVLGNGNTSGGGTIPAAGTGSQLMIGNAVGGGYQFTGSVMGVRASVNGMQVVNSVATAAGLTDPNITWALQGSAAPAVVVTNPSMGSFIGQSAYMNSGMTIDANLPTTQGQSTIAPNTLFGAYIGGDDTGWKDYEKWLGAKHAIACMFTGEGIESDFQNITYDIGVSGYTGNAFVSIPMLYSGTTLAQAAAGNLDADYNEQFTRLLTTTFINQQSVIYVRLGWEQNQGNMKWKTQSDSTLQAQFIQAWQRQHAQALAALAAYTPPTGFPQPVFKFVFCPAQGGDDPTLTYPGDAYVDAIGIDFYVYANFGQPVDPTANWSFQRNNDGNGGATLDWVTSFATAHSKEIVIPEYGIDLDNYGPYLKLMHAWCNQWNVKWVSYWDSNASYTGILGSKPSYGNYNQVPSTAAMYRYLVNPQRWPHDPDTQPGAPGVVVEPGNNKLRVHITNVPSLTGPATTGYVLYLATSSNGETTGQPITLTNGYYDITGLTNNGQYFVIVTAVNANGESPPSGETAGSPTTAMQPLAVTMGNTGILTSNPAVPAGLQNIGTSTLDIAVDFIPTQADLNNNSATFVGMWGSSSAYVRRFAFSIGTSTINIQWQGQSNDIGLLYTTPGQTGFVPGNAYTARVLLNCTAGEAQFTSGPYGGTPHIDNVANTSISSAGINGAYTDPKTGDSTTLIIGNVVESGQQFTGGIFGVRISVGGVQVINSTMTSSGLHDGNVTWVASGGAVVTGG